MLNSLPVAYPKDAVPEDYPIVYPLEFDRNMTSYCANATDLNPSITKPCDLCIGYIPNEPMYRSNAGFMFEYTEIICDKMHVHCCYISLPYAAYGQQVDNETWDGVMNDILTGAIDTSLPNFGFTTEREDALDFSETVLRVPVGFAFLPVEADTVSARTASSTFLTASFSPQSWMLVVAFFFIIGLGLYTLTSINFRSRRRRFRVARHLLNSLVLLSGNDIREDSGEYTQRYPRAMSVFYTTAIFGAMFLGLFYSATLASRSIAPPVDLPFEDMEGLADRILAGRYKIAMKSLSNSIYATIGESNASYYTKYYMAMRRHGWTEIPFNSSLDQFLDLLHIDDRVNQGEQKPMTHYVIAGDLTGLEYTVLRYSCDYRIVTNEDHILDMRYPFHKNSSIRPRLKFAMTTVKRLDIINLLKKRYSTVRKCPKEMVAKIQELSRNNRLSFQQVKFSLVPMGLGSFLGMLAFLYEYRRRRRRPRKQQNVETGQIMNWPNYKPAAASGQSHHKTIGSETNLRIPAHHHLHFSNNFYINKLNNDNNLNNHKNPVKKNRNINIGSNRQQQLQPSLFNNFIPSPRFFEQKF